MLHKHAATVRPYPLPTRQHAAARPNSRQIRQMSAMPANPPFHSQLAARPNNRRHRQPTATHPPTTSTPNLSQTLMISRQTLVISRTALIRALASSRRPTHPENPQKSCKSSFRQPPQSLVNSRHLSSNTHTSAPAPASPLPSRKSPKIMQILLQTTPPTQITAHPQYPMTSYKRCYYPLSTIHYPLVSTKNLPTARSGAFVL